MFIENGKPANEYEGHHERAENAPSMSRDGLVTGVTTTARPTFVSTPDIAGLPHDSLQEAVSFDLRLESAFQRVEAKAPTHPVETKDESMTITNEQINEWRQQKGLKLIGTVVDQILDFLTMIPLVSLLEIAALVPQFEVLPIPFSFLTTLHSIRKTYQLSDPDWWPLLRPQDVIGDADSTLMAKHNLAVATLFLLQDNKLPDLHEEFLNIYVLPNERLEVWHADLYFAIKITIVNNDWPMSDLLFSGGFPDPASRVLKRRNQYHDELPDDMSDGEHLLYSRCAYVRSQYNAGALTADEVHKLRGGRTWCQSIQRALPHIIHLVKRVQQDPSLIDSNAIDLQGQFARPNSHVVPTKGRIALSPDDLPGTTAMLAEAMGQAVRRLAENRSPTPNTQPVEDSAVSGATFPFTAAQSIPHEPTPTIEVASMTNQPAPSRRPWTSEEESALLTGLATVGGPHWSQILALYGASGSVSNVLRDRGQVQLKDKARNLKLSYLKAGKEVPSELRGVTGSLGKRKRARQGDSKTVEDEDMDMDV